MTVADELAKLQTNLSNSYSACQEKGAMLPSKRNFDNLPATIGSITGGGGGGSSDKWQRPSEWPAMDKIDLTDFEGVYLLYDTTLNIGYISIQAQTSAGNYLIEEIDVDNNGNVTVLNSFSYTRNTTNGIMFEDQNKRFHIYRVRPQNAGATFSYVYYATSVINGVRWHGASQPIIEVIARTNATRFLPQVTDTQCLTTVHIKLVDCQNIVENAYHGFCCNSPLLECVDLVNSWALGFGLENRGYDGFYNCTSLEEINGLTEFFSHLEETRANKFSNMFDYATKLKSADLSGINVNVGTSLAYMFYHTYSLESVNLSNMDTSNVTTMNSMFNRAKKIKTLDLSNFNTSKVTTFTYMFNGCESLESLDLSSFDLTSATHATQMMYDCARLKDLKFKPNKAPALTTCTQMFCRCWSLENLDLSEFETSSKLTACNEMFNNCIRLQEISLQKFITSSVTNMGSMFAYCFQLKKISAPLMTAEKATNVSSMFNSCYSIEEIDMPLFNPTLATSFGTMFYFCEKLTRLDLSHWTNSVATSYNNMFSGCLSLEYLDMRNMDAIKVTNVTNMFATCSALVDFYPPKNINVSGLTFSACKNLSHDSMVRVLNSLTSSSTKKTVTFAKALQGTLTDEEIAIATSKNWNIGWS